MQLIFKTFVTKQFSAVLLQIFFIPTFHIKVSPWAGSPKLVLGADLNATNVFFFRFLDDQRVLGTLHTDLVVTATEYFSEILVPVVYKL